MRRAGLLREPIRITITNHSQNAFGELEWDVEPDLGLHDRLEYINTKARVVFNTGNREQENYRDDHERIYTFTIRMGNKLKTLTQPHDDTQRITIDWRGLTFDVITVEPNYIGKYYTIRAEQQNNTIV